MSVSDNNRLFILMLNWRIVFFIKFTNDAINIDMLNLHENDDMLNG